MRTDKRPENLGDNVMYVPKIKYEYINKTGTKLKYNSVRSFGTGLNLVAYDQKNMILDNSGSEIVISEKGQYRIYDFSDGVSVVYKNNKWGIIANPFEGVVALPLSSKIMLDNIPKALDGYMINNNSYFKIRDLAVMLSNTEKQFDVVWDESKKAINLITNKPYTSTKSIKANNKETTAVISNAKVLKNGIEIKLIIYTIDGEMFLAIAKYNKWPLKIQKYNPCLNLMVTS